MCIIDKPSHNSVSHHYSHFTDEETGSEWLRGLLQATRPSTASQELDPHASRSALGQLCLQWEWGLPSLCLPVSPSQRPDVQRV